MPSRLLAKPMRSPDGSKDKGRKSFIELKGGKPLHAPKQRILVHGLLLLLVLLSCFALYSRLVPSYAPGDKPQDSSEIPQDGQNGDPQPSDLTWRDYYPSEPIVKYFTGGFENGGYIEIYAHTEDKEILLYNLNGAVNTVQLIDFSASVPQIYVMPVDEAASLLAKATPKSESSETASTETESSETASINSLYDIMADYISPYPILAYREVLRASQGRPLYTDTSLKTQQLVNRMVNNQEIEALEISTTSENANASETPESLYIQRFAPGLGLVSTEFWTYDDQNVGSLFLEDALVHSAKPPTLSFDYSTRLARFPYAQIQKAISEMGFTNPQITMLWDYGASSEWLVLETENRDTNSSTVDNGTRLHRIQLGLGAFPLKRNTLMTAPQAMATDAASRFTTLTINAEPGPLEYGFVGSGYEHTGYGAVISVVRFQADGSSEAALYDLQGEEPAFVEAFKQGAMAQSVFPEGLDQSLVIVGQYIVYMAVDDENERIYRAYSRELGRFVADFPIEGAAMPVFPLTQNDDGIVVLAQYTGPVGNTSASSNTNAVGISGIGFDPRSGSFLKLKP